MQKNKRSLNNKKFYVKLNENIKLNENNEKKKQPNAQKNCLFEELMNYKFLHSWEKNLTALHFHKMHDY